MFIIGFLDVMMVSGSDCGKFIFSLVLPENMDEMVKLITQEPEDDMEDKVKYKLVNQKFR